MLHTVTLLLLFTCASAQFNEHCNSYTGDGEVGWTWYSLKITKCNQPNTLTSIPDVEADTQVLLITSQPITSIKQNQFVSSNKLQSIRVADCKISVVESHAFQNMTNLAVLSLYNNLISSLPTDLFIDTPNIEEIYLGGNKLHSLQQHLFSNLQRLRIIHLFSNGMTSIEENTFINLPRLNVLRLYNNKLKNLNLNIMSNPQLLNLNILDITLNPWHCDIMLCEIMSVYLNTFTLWYKPHNHRLNKQMCTSPTELAGKSWQDAISICNSTTTLKPSERFCNGCNCTGNPLTITCQESNHLQLPNELIKDVVHLNMTGQPNQTHGMFIIGEHEFRHFHHLQTLYLEKNKIQTIEPNAFKSLKNITLISLAYNKLTSLKKNMFTNLTHLSKVDLSHNEINYVEDNCFVNVPSLEIVDLSSNKLKTLKLTIFDDASKLLSLALHDNQWNCDDSLCEVMDIVLSRELWPADKEPTCSSPLNIHAKPWSRILSKFNPAITSKISSVIVGNDVTLRCNYCFASRVVWNFNGKKLPNSFQKIYNSTAELSLKNVGTDKKGYYECQVKNCNYCKSDEVLLNVTNIESVGVNEGTFFLLYYSNMLPKNRTQNYKRDVLNGPSSTSDTWP